MDIWIICVALFCGAAVAQSLFIGSFLLLKDRAKTMAIIWLSVMLFALSMRIGKSFYYYILPSISNMGVVLGGVGLWMIGPAFWFYFKTSQYKKINPLEYLHFLPALLIAILGPVYRMTLLIPSYHVGAFILGIYLLSALFIFYKNEWPGKKRGVGLIIYSLMAIWLTFIFQYFSPSIEWYAISGGIACLVMYVINFHIMKDQDLFAHTPLTRTSVPEEVSMAIRQDLELLFGEQKIYRKKGLTIAMVANEMERPAYLISKTINQHFGVKFNAYVNQYRVQEVKEKLRDLKSNHKVEAIASEVGFSSTSSLYHAFKKETQLTLQQYRVKFATQNA